MYFIQYSGEHSLVNTLNIRINNPDRFQAIDFLHDVLVDAAEKAFLFSGLPLEKIDEAVKSGRGIPSDIDSKFKPLARSYYLFRKRGKIDDLRGKFNRAHSKMLIFAGNTEWFTFVKKTPSESEDKYVFYFFTFAAETSARYLRKLLGIVVEKETFSSAVKNISQRKFEDLLKMKTPPWPTLDALIKAYPELKIRKPPGRRR